MLKDIDGWDKGEGSWFYDATKPVAIELEHSYKELYRIDNNISLDTATGTELTELCYQNGTTRKTSTKAIRKGIFNVEIPIGARFGADDTTYVVLEKIIDYEYKLECEQPGRVGNFHQGTITAFEHIDNLESAELTDVIVVGVEEETDDQLRTRHKRRLNEGEQNGNKSQYRIWAEEFEGIGAVKVFPLWNGGNTVKVAITDRLYQVADSTLINSFQKYLDPNSEGLGNGVAPIGSKVTVTGGMQKDINIAGNIELVEGYSEPDGVAASILEYLASVTYASKIVSYMRIGSAILDTPSVAGLSDLRVNGTMEDVIVEGEEIPTLNSVNLTVVSP